MLVSRPFIVMAGLDPATQRAQRDKKEKLNHQEDKDHQESVTRAGILVIFVFLVGQSFFRAVARTLGGRVKPGHDELFLVGAT